MFHAALIGIHIASRRQSICFRLIVCDRALWTLTQHKVPQVRPLRFDFCDFIVF